MLKIRICHFIIITVHLMGYFIEFPFLNVVPMSTYFAWLPLNTYMLTSVTYLKVGFIMTILINIISIEGRLD